MRTIPFAKVVGCGNDFLLVDRRGRSPLKALPSLARAWCDRKSGVGADGLLLVLGSRRADVRMRIFNPDGTEARMCGNGLRCVAWYLHARNGLERTLTVETGDGLLRTEVVGRERIRLNLTPPRQLHLGIRLTVRGRRTLVHSVRIGVPHAVLFLSHPDRVDLAAFGPAIRRHRHFQPDGTNVNLARVESPHRIRIRTFERGVEAETLACGTGAVASAVIGTALGRLRPPVMVQTASGQSLTVGFRESRRPWENLSLEGPARILFEGGLPR